MQLTRFLLLALGLVAFTNAHIRMSEPPGRSSLWRDPRFDQFNPAVNNNDDGVYCGRILQPLNVTNCGVCGDPFSDPLPRPNEHGGTYGKGIIAGNFSVGREIQMAVLVTIPHNGSFHVQICDELPESDACFFRNPKLLLTHEGRTMTDIPIGMDIVWINGTMRLPAGMSCRNCVLRLNYRSGLLGECADGSQDYGCGLQQNFRMCSDISISI